MRKTLFIIGLGLMVLCGGCRSKKSDIKLDPTEMGSDKKMYETALKQISRDPEKARLLFKELMQLYPDSVYAVRSKLGIADSYFKEKDSSSLIMAASEYQEFVNLFPYSPDAIYAKYQIAICYYKQIKRPGRDQTNTFSAIKAFEQTIEQYPNAKEADTAKKKIAECRQILATHFFRIGYYNYVLKAPFGAINRFKQVIDEYPDFAQNDKLYFFTGKTYFLVRDYESAMSFFQRIITSFPKSKYVKSAERQIVQCQKLLQAKEKNKPGAEANEKRS